MSRPHTMPAAVLPDRLALRLAEGRRDVVGGASRWQARAHRAARTRIVVVSGQTVASAGRQPLQKPAALKPSQIPLHATQLLLDCL
jgi:hypothetical protein